MEALQFNQANAECITRNPSIFIDFIVSVDLTNRTKLFILGHSLAEIKNSPNNSIRIDEQPNMNSQCFLSNFTVEINSLNQPFQMKHCDMFFWTHESINTTKWFIFKLIAIKLSHLDYFRWCWKMVFHWFYHWEFIRNGWKKMATKCYVVYMTHPNIYATPICTMYESFFIFLNCYFVW